MKKKIDHAAEHAACDARKVARDTLCYDAVYLPCPFCGTKPGKAPMLGAWCDNDDCAIVGVVFSGGARHWNKRAALVQGQLFAADE